MPNGETAAATGSVNRGTASRIGFQVGQIGASRRHHNENKTGKSSGFVSGTNIRTQVGKPKGYSTERAMKAIRSGNKARGIASPSEKKVAATHKNFTAAKKRTSKGRKKKSA